ncbi:TPA: hypothetical protein ACF6GP_000793 [Legionella pneumophila]
MSTQIVTFLREIGSGKQNANNIDCDILNIIRSTYLYSQNENQLIFNFDFDNSDKLKQFDINILLQAIYKLELYLDINFFILKISYKVQMSGQFMEILIFNKEPFMRGLSFEIEERDMTYTSINQSKTLSSKFIDKRLRIAQAFYSTGLALLSLEDQIIGSLESAFNQFYLAIESLTQKTKGDEAQTEIMKLFNDKNMAKIVSHVYIVRGMYFMHSNSKSEITQDAIISHDISTQIAKQTLVARWCARHLLSLYLDATLINREMRLYLNSTESIAFNGNASQLESEFKIPKPMKKLHLP